MEGIQCDFNESTNQISCFGVITNIDISIGINISIGK